MVLALCLAAPAWAGTYYWPLPTAQAPGPANPDHDAYGARPVFLAVAAVQTVARFGVAVTGLRFRPAQAGASA